VSAPGRATPRLVGILGGSFDPVHVGHLRTGFEVLQSCGLDELRLVPSGQPPHRAAPVAPAALRIAMLRAACAGQPGFVVDERETRRNGPSWTWDTLTSLRAELGDARLAVIIGGDAFLGLPTWHRWTELTDLAHFIVVHRPGFELPTDGPLADFIAAHRAGSATELRRLAHGRLWVQPVTQLEISSSAIRALVAAGGDPRFLVPEAVRAIILDSQVFRPAVPSGRHERGAAN
jgi:nicotinate-nucleotide adenylyltransferase